MDASFKIFDNIKLIPDDFFISISLQISDTSSESFFIGSILMLVVFSNSLNLSFQFCWPAFYQC